MVKPFHNFDGNWFKRAVSRVAAGHQHTFHIQIAVGAIPLP